MGLISQESIDRVAAASDIVEVIGSYFPLKRTGSNYRGLCPFHNEKSPSFHVHPGRQSFHCFGCGAGGGVFRFVMDYEHLDFPSAVRRLADRAGVPLIEESDPEVLRERSQRSRLLELHRKATLWFQQHLLKSPEAASAREYLKGRGLHKEIALSWQLGYAPQSWDSLLCWGKAEGFSREEMVASGLVSEGEKGRFYDRFRHRVIFPICNDYGEVIGFSGRTLSESKEEAKYINSPETLLFHKSCVLFGLHRSKKEIATQEEAILLEGQIDVITAFEEGCRQVVAPQGTAFTQEQARLLRRFASRVLLCFDGDAAGKKAAERALPLLFAEGFEVRVLFLPEGEDPDSLIRREGVAVFQERVAEAKDFFQDRLDAALVREKKEGLSTKEKAQLIHLLGGLLHLLPDRAHREVLRSEIALRLGVSVATLEQVPPHNTTTPSQEEQTVATAFSSEQNPPLSPGVTLLARLAWFDDQVALWLSQQDHKTLLAQEEGGLILEEIMKLKAHYQQEENRELFLKKVLATASPQLQQLIAGWDEGKQPEEPLAVAQQTFRGMEISFWRRKQAQKTEELKKRGLSANDLIKIQQEILDLQHKINDVSKFPEN